MRFYSFVRDGFYFTPSEIQVSLLPGLPDVVFTGLVDMAIKESATRLKSAFRKSGFQWPLKQKVIINLSPAYFKKSSPGMDLALAAAILWNTGQMDFSHYHSSSVYFYGEVDLDGKVLTPRNWKALPLGDKNLVIGSLEDKNYKNNVFSVDHLRGLLNPRKLPVEDWKDQLEVPEIPEISFSQRGADLLKISASGEHSLLFCGPSGSGKTTLGEHLHYLLSAPKRQWFEDWEQLFNFMPKWRAFISPHHSITPMSMIGGGAPLFPGEISKAHGGLLFLDEYLEFHPKIQEALREPLEKGKIRIVRKGCCQVFPARFFLVATSNLCPCGDYEPCKSIQCSYSLRRCQSYLDRLSGPMLDRFDLLAFSKDWKGERNISLKKIKEDIDKACFFRLHKRGQTELNSNLELKLLEKMISKDVNFLLPESSSHRRKRALLRVARTVSDLKQENDISPLSLEQAMTFSVKNFFFLKNRIISA